MAQQKNLFGYFAEKASSLSYSTCFILKGSQLLRIIKGHQVNTLHPASMVMAFLESHHLSDKWRQASTLWSTVFLFKTVTTVGNRPSGDCCSSFVDLFLTLWLSCFSHGDEIHGTYKSDNIFLKNDCFCSSDTCINKHNPTNQKYPFSLWFCAKVDSTAYTARIWSGMKKCAFSLSSWKLGVKIPCLSAGLTKVLTPVHFNPAGVCWAGQCQPRRWNA